MFVDRDEEGEREGEREGWFGLFLEAISETIAAPGGGRGNRKVSVPRDCSSLLLSDLHTPASPLLFRCAEVFRFSGEAQVKFFASRIGNIPRCIHFLVFQDDGLISTARIHAAANFTGRTRRGIRMEVGRENLPIHLCVWQTLPPPEQRRHSLGIRKVITAF